MIKFIFLFLIFITPYVDAYAGIGGGETITITEDTQLNFAKLQKPTSGTNYITIDPSTGGYSGTAVILTGVPSRGAYTIKRTGIGTTTSMTIDVTVVSTGSAGLTINQLTGECEGTDILSFPRSGLAKPKGSGSTLYLGATATYNSSVPSSTLTPSLDITVTLQ